MSSVEQVEDNLSHIDEARAGCLSDDDKRIFEEVKKAFNAVFKIHCAGCNYCMPCPRGVNIPGAFSSYNTSYAIGWGAGIQQYVTSTSAQAKTNSCASRCISCGKCESHCPQHIRIREELTRTKRRFEPFYIRLLFAITRLFLH
jgi:predicted aldo/keto reductase-like oxidoreductase